MKLHYLNTKENFKSRNLCLCIGNFDGIHLGHQHVIRKIIKNSKSDNLKSAIMTFIPHPKIYFKKTESNFNIITNVYYDNIGTDFSEYSFIITSTYNYNIRWSSFVENQTIFQQNKTISNFGGGLAYLYIRNLQINSSLRFLLEGQAQGYYLSLGVSYRIDKHVDKFTLLDDNGNEIRDTPINKFNKKQEGFFNRLFSIFTKKGSQNKSRKRVKRKRKN